MGKRFSFGLSSVITVIQFASMAFLIICCVTAPVFSEIGLSKYDSTTYGTFGYCKNSECSSASANYSPGSIDSDGDWSMSQTARTSLGKILIVIPIAAGLAFFALIVNFVAHFSAVNRHAALFIVNLLLSLLAFASSALVCIVVFLLFYPHVTWCSWLLIPAAVLNMGCIPLTYLAHSRAGNDEDEDDYEFNDEQKLNRLDLSGSQDSFRLNGYNNESKTSVMEKPLPLPDYYKGSQIVTSTTLNSGTTDSRSDREGILGDQQPVNPYSKSALNGSAMMPLSEEANDLSYESSDLKQTRPFSVIQDSETSLGRSGNGSSNTGLAQNFNAPNQFYRDPSNTSSFYSENVKGVSRADSMNTTDLKPNSVLGLNENRKKINNDPSGHDVLQGIIKKAIEEEDDDEFIKQQTMDASEIPSLDDDDGIKDDGSDFTSVSQRGINPNYIPAAATVNKINHPLSLSKNSHPAARPMVSTALPSQYYSAPPAQQVYTNYANAPAFQHHPPQVYYQQPVVGYPQQSNPAPQRAQYTNPPNTSDMLLNSNPDFMVGRNARRQRGTPMYPQAGTGSSTHYRPAYKNRLPRQNRLPPASMARDGAYSGMM